MTLLDQRMVETASAKTLPPFAQRHIGPASEANQLMLDRLGFSDLERFCRPSSRRTFSIQVRPRGSFRMELEKPKRSLNCVSLPVSTA